jgi:hypothetical protein
MNCIGCVHSFKGVCSLSKRVEETRCIFYEDKGKWYRTEGGSDASKEDRKNV